MKNLKLFTVILFTLVSFVFLTGCGKEAGMISKTARCVQNSMKPVFGTNNFNNLPDYNYDSTVCGLLPLGKNYQWIYRDSLFDNTGQFTETRMDTLRVEKTVVSLMDKSVSWKMNAARSKGIPSYIYTTDSVLYFIDRPYNYNSNSAFIATEWLKIYSSDSVTKFSFVSDYGYRETIKKLSAPVKVPAGVFTNCIQNSKFTTGVEVIIFKPELGVVKYTKYSPYGNPFNPVPADKRQVSELVSCSLQ
jgi:hypothetical protein